MEIPAHKMVLAACSPYFYAMFSVSEFEESRQDRITVQGVDFVALQLLVEYVYTSIVDVTEENVQVKIECAVRFLRNLFKNELIFVGSVNGRKSVAIDGCTRRML